MKNKNRLAATTFLAASSFATGFAGLVTEYVMATTATHLMGNGIFQWSITISVMLFMMGVGSFGQKLVKKNLIEKFALIEITLALVGAFAPLQFYWTFSVIPEYFPVIQIFVICILGLLVGFEIPLIMRVNKDFQDLADNAAWIFGLDYVGSFVGALVWIIFFLPNVALTQVSFLVAVMNLCVAGVTLLYFYAQGQLRKPWLLLFIFGLTISILLHGWHKNLDWAISLEQRFFSDQVIHSETTRFQHVVVTKNQKTDVIKLYLNGQIQFSSFDEGLYHEFLVQPAMELTKQHSKVLILGGGDGFAAREVLKHSDVGSITLVDIDPRIVEISREIPEWNKLTAGAYDNAEIYTSMGDGAFSSKGTQTLQLPGKKRDKDGNLIHEDVADIQVLHVDASVYLDNLADKFDVIIIDFPDPTSAELSKLYSLQAFDRIAEKLAPHGVIAIQATSPLFAPDVYATIGNTMEKAGLNVVPYHYNVPSFGEWGWFLAYHQGDRRSLEFENELAKWDEMSVKTTYLTPQLFNSSLVFPKEWLAGAKVELNTVSSAAVWKLYQNSSWRY